VLVKLIHANGKEYVLPAAQVVVLSDDGRPLAVTYEEAGLIVHNDASKPDFGRACSKLRLAPPEVQVLGDLRT
jgi:hypothetical protein